MSTPTNSDALIEHPAATFIAEAADALAVGDITGAETCLGRALIEIARASDRPRRDGSMIGEVRMLVTWERCVNHGEHLAVRRAVCRRAADA